MLLVPNEPHRSKPDNVYVNYIVPNRLGNCIKFFSVTPPKSNSFANNGHSWRKPIRHLSVNGLLLRTNFNSKISFSTSIGENVNVWILGNFDHFRR